MSLVIPATLRGGAHRSHYSCAREGGAQGFSLSHKARQKQDWSRNPEAQALHTGVGEDRDELTVFQPSSDTQSCELMFSSYTSRR